MQNYPNVEELAISSADILMNSYVLRNRPVVITNFQDRWQRELLSSSELLRMFGDEIVRVSVSPSGRFDGPEPGPLWGLSDDKDVLVRYSGRPAVMHFCEFECTV